MNNGKLSLADFKAKAEKVTTNELLDKVRGGELSACHTLPPALPSLNGGSQ